MATDWENAIAAGGTALEKAEARDDHGRWTGPGLDPKALNPAKRYAIHGVSKDGKVRPKPVHPQLYDTLRHDEVPGKLSTVQGLNPSNRYAVVQSGRTPEGNAQANAATRIARYLHDSRGR